ncbi:putative Protein disulfide-isomerase [Blattamonas nauphoetae]|uniref:protein disulfide-isomerase n=1 Tax=Blattamonas nauphoetae TaxID=2049346 RepID=A0ABQ9YM80_9EUKA|nr:putative Protein disulfide-isomerase [Blattamonas nauphoetae]
MLSVLILCISSIFSHNRVVDLTPETFIEEAQKGNLLVKFYSTNCRHCKNLAPEYQALANVFRRMENNVTIAEINCNTHESFCDNEGIEGYPIIRWYSNSTSHEDYNGRRKLDSLQKYVGEKLGKVYRDEFTEIVQITDENFDDIVMDPKKNVLLAFTAPWCTHCRKMKPHLEALAGVFYPKENIVIAQMDGDKYSDITDQYPVPGFPTLLFFPAVYEGDEERMRMLNETLSEQEEFLKTIEQKKEKKIQKKPNTTDGKSEQPAKKFKGFREIVVFKGKPEIGSLLTFVNKHTGIYRKPDNSILQSAGTVKGTEDEMLQFIAAFIRRSRAQKKGEEEVIVPLPEKKSSNGTKHNQTETENAQPDFDPFVGVPMLEETESNFLNSLNYRVYPSNVYQTYQRYMTALKERGIDFLVSEQARLKKIIDSNSVAQHLQSQLVIRYNVIKMMVSIYRTVDKF